MGTPPKPKPKCRKEQLAYGEAQRDETKAYQEVEKAKAEVKRLQKEEEPIRRKASEFIRLCADCIRTTEGNPLLQDKLCRPVCKKADEWDAKFKKKRKELNKAKRNLKQKKKERKEATKRKNEAYKAWKKCLRESK